LIVIHADAELEARRARLRDLHPRRADLKLIADADRVFQPAGDGEILAELAVWKTFALRTPLTLSPALSLKGEGVFEILLLSNVICQETCNEKD
jgi:hypothetical protein